MPFFDEISKRFGANKGPDTKGGPWPRPVANDELPPQRLWPSENYEPQPMRHGIWEVKIENGRIVPPEQPKKRRLPQESRFVRDSDQHNDYLRDGGLPPRDGDE
jgi:hypothetical protein